MKKLISCVAVFALVLSCCMAASASVAYPGPYTYRQPSGEKVNYISHGDENWSSYSSNGYNVTLGRDNHGGWVITYLPEDSLVFEIQKNFDDGYWYYTKKSEEYELRCSEHIGSDPFIILDRYDPTDPEYIAFMEEHPNAFGYYLHEPSDKKFLIDVPDEVYLDISREEIYILTEADKEAVRAMNKAAADNSAAERAKYPGAVAVMKLIEKLPDKADIEYTDKETVAAASQAYDALTNEEMEIVVPFMKKKLQDVEYIIKNFEIRIRSDVDGNGEVNVLDLIAEKAFIMTKDETLGVDVDLDGKVDVNDLSAIRRAVLYAD